jgi:reactive intermediate/imine deaminase
MSTRREFLEVAAPAAMGLAAKSKERIQMISSSGAPKAIGPYSHAIKAGNVVYASGQIPLDPATGNLVEGDFAAQARRVFENLKAVLHDAGTDFGRVAKATVYLTDLANFASLNAIYAEYFGDHKPARSTIGVAQLPRGAAVEIDLVAIG